MVEMSPLPGGINTVNTGGTGSGDDVCKLLYTVRLLWFATVAPKISCWSAEAAVGQRDVTLTCTLDARPPLTSLFWIIDANGTTLTDSDMHHEFRAVHLHVRTVYK